MMYQIAIPSYRRATICNERTLRTLQICKIDPELITVFVVEDEYQDYLNILNPYWYGNIVIGKKGLIEQREFIADYYKVGSRIISMDDDIESIDLSMTGYESLDVFFTEAFHECEIHNAYIWGVYPVYNQFFRKDRIPITYGLSFLIGAFYGYINREDNPRIELIRNGNKEDVERSLLYYERDGIVIRFNKVGFKTKYYGTDGGGLGRFDDRLDIMARASRAIHEKYPSETKIKVRKNGMTEIVFLRDI